MGRTRAVGSRPVRADGLSSREAILAAAGRSFAQVGYDATTIRKVASAVGVDPALVMHYFGSKAQLFAASLEGSMPGPAQLLASLDGSRVGFAERFVRVYVSLWEDPTSGPAVMSVVRSALSNPMAADVVRSVLEGRLIASGVQAHWPAERVNLAGAQVFGMAVARYVLGTQPLAALSTEDLVALMVPAVRATLND